jgi:superfamily II DNA helicase RecQ
VPPRSEGLLTASTQTVPVDDALAPSSHVGRAANPAITPVGLTSVVVTRCTVRTVPDLEDVLAGLNDAQRAQADGVLAYVVFHDRRLAVIAERGCKDLADLAAITGIGAAKLERYADEVLAIVGAG